MINGHSEPHNHTHHRLSLKEFSQLVLEAFKIPGLNLDYFPAVGLTSV